MHEHRLANGLEIIVVENRLTPLASVALAIRHGVKDEGPKQTGLAHLFEHMLFRPNQALPTEAQLKARKLELGIGILGGTSEDAVRFGVTTHRANLEAVFGFVRDMVVSPRFDAEVLANEKRVLAQEDSHRVWSGANLVAVDRLLWWKHPTRKWDIGEGANLGSLTVADLQRTKSRYYVPNNAALIVVGDVQPVQVFHQAEQVFASWQSPPHARRGLPPVLHPPLQGNQVVVNPLERPNPSGSLFWHGPSLPGRDAALARAAQLLSVAFKLPSNARQRLEKRCDAFDLAWTPSSNVGVIEFRWQATPERADDCLLGALEELPKLVSSFTDQELAAAVQTTETPLLQARELPETLLRDLAGAWAAGDVSQCLAAETHLAAVTRKDFARLVDKFISERPFVLSVSAPKDLIAKGMDVAHFKSLIGRRRAVRLQP